MNFTMSELIHSDTANRLKINNMPDINSLDNLLNLICGCLQPIRGYIKRPIIITSGYRCKALNSAVSGVKNSAHLYGRAADFIIKGLTPKDIIKLIKKSGVKYTQLIEEHSKNNHWVHIEYNPKNLKQETLIFQNGVYTKVI